MRIVVDTPWGRRRYAVRSLADVNRALRVLQAASERDLAMGMAPPLWESGAVYRREGSIAGRRARRVREDWKRAARVWIEGDGDCEDLAAYRAAELRVSGEDPGAYAEAYSPRAGLVHVIVRRSGGAIEDPSRALGMGAMDDQIRWKVARKPQGTLVKLAVPYVGHDGEPACAISEGRGRTKGGALRKAVDAQFEALREVGVLDECEGCPSEVGFDSPALSDEAQGLLGELGANARGGSVPGVADVIRRGVEAEGGGGGDIDWEDAAKKAVTAGCAAALAATGVASWAAPACLLIGPIWDKIREWITVKVSPWREFAEAAEAEIPEVWGAGSYKRFKAIQPTKDKASYDRQIRDRTAQGWSPSFEWSKQYGEAYQWGSGKGRYYAAVFDREAAPASVRDKWMTTGAEDIRLLMLPQAQMVSEYGAILRARGGGGLPHLPLDLATADDLRRYREFGATKGIEIPDSAAPDSRIMREPAYAPLREIFSREAGAAEAVDKAPREGGAKTVAERHAAEAADFFTRAETPREARLAGRTKAELRNLRSAVQLAQDRDWAALRDFASILRRTDPRSTVGRIARMLVR